MISYRGLRCSKKSCFQIVFLSRRTSPTSTGRYCFSSQPISTAGGRLLKPNQSAARNDLLNPILDAETDRMFKPEDWEDLHAKLLAKSTLSPEDVEEAEHCLRWLTSAARSDKGNVMVPSAFVLFDHINSIIRAQDEKQTKGQRLSRLQQPSSIQFIWLEGDYPRSIHLFNAILDAWRNTGRVSPDPISMFEYLRSRDDIQLNARSYTILIRAIMDTTKVTLAPLYCEKVLSWMQEAQEPRYTSYRRSVRPDSLALSSVLHAWTKSGRTDAAERAELLFNDYLKVYKSFPNAQLTTHCYNTLLGAILSKTRRKLSTPEIRLRLERAEHVFRGMLEHKSKKVAPTQLSFHHMIFAWCDYYAHCRENSANDMADAIVRASALLERLVYLYRETKNRDLAPHPHMFAKIIAALGTSNPKPEHLSRAEKLYRHMQRLYTETGDSAFSPDVHTLRAMLIVYCKMGRLDDAEQHLERLENDPNMSARVGHYRDLLSARIEQSSIYLERGRYEACRKSLELAEKLMMHVVEQAETTERKDIVPPQEFVTRLLELWARCRDPERAETLLRKVQKLHKDNGFALLKPKEPAYRRVMNAYGSMGTDADGKRAEKVQELLHELCESYHAGDPDMQPTKQTYNEAIVAWARTDRADRLERGMAILEQVRSSFRSGRGPVCPDTALYGAVMKACARLGALETAEHLLHQMLDDYKRGNKLSRPNIGILNMVMLSCLRSSDPHQSERAMALYNLIGNINETHDFSLFPNERTYSLIAEIMTKSTDPDHVAMAADFVKKMHLTRQRQRTQEARSVNTRAWTS